MAQFGNAVSYVRFEDVIDKSGQKTGARKLKGTVRLIIPCPGGPDHTLAPMKSQEPGLVATLRAIGAVEWADNLTAAIADRDEGVRLLTPAGSPEPSKPKSAPTIADWRTLPEAKAAAPVKASVTVTRKSQAQKAAESRARVPAIGSTPGAVRV